MLTPVAFLRRLAALIPPPRQNQTRSHGVLAAHAKLRAAVTALVPGNLGPAPHAHHAELARPARPNPSRLPWPALILAVSKPRSSS